MLSIRVPEQERFRGLTNGFYVTANGMLLDAQSVAIVTSGVADISGIPTLAPRTLAVTSK